MNGEGDRNVGAGDVNDGNMPAGGAKAVDGGNVPDDTLASWAHGGACDVLTSGKEGDEDNEKVGEWQTHIMDGK